jgi:hypothetical protein
MRWIVVLLAAPLWAQEAPDLKAIVERAFEADVRNQELAKNYTYEEHMVERKLDSHGNVKETETKTYDVTYLYGEEYRRLVKRDGEPLPADEAAKEQKKLDKAVEERENESAREREKRLVKQRKDDDEIRKMRAEIIKAYEFTLEGEEEREGVKCWRIRAEPKADYEPSFRKAKVLTKLRGKIWIAESDYGWVGAEAETIENASFGLFLLKLKKGAVLEFEQRKINDEVWLMDTFRLKFDARVALFKGLRREIETDWGKFRKFSAESRMVVEEP